MKVNYNRTHWIIKVNDNSSTADIIKWLESNIGNMYKCCHQWRVVEPPPLAQVQIIGQHRIEIAIEDKNDAMQAALRFECTP